MDCELCGRAARNTHIIRLEGAELVVCDGCASHGTRVEQSSGPRFQGGYRPMPRRPVYRDVDAASKVEFVSDYAAVIHNAREKAGLTQEELGAKITETSSVLQRLEQGKISLMSGTAAKLEKVLGITLIVVPKEGDAAKADATAKAEKKADAIEPEPRKTANGPLTLGDIVFIKKK